MAEVKTELTPVQKRVKVATKELENKLYVIIKGHSLVDVNHRDARALAVNIRETITGFEDAGLDPIYDTETKLPKDKRSKVTYETTYTFTKRR